MATRHAFQRAPLLLSKKPSAMDDHYSESNSKTVQAWNGRVDPAIDVLSGFYLQCTRRCQGLRGVGYLTALITKRIKKSFIRERIGRILEFGNLGSEGPGRTPLLTVLLWPRDGCIALSRAFLLVAGTHG